MQRLCFVLLATSLLVVPAAAQQQPGSAAPVSAAPVSAASVRATVPGNEIAPQLARVIDGTAALDNHAHPVLSPPKNATDREFDALPVDNMAPETDPVAWRPDWPKLHDAWLALWGVDLQAPVDAAGMQQLEAARARVKAREGIDYSVWVLNQAGIGTEVANRVAMGTGVVPPHFLWVPYDDALLFPLNNSALMKQTPDRAQFFPLEEALRARYLKDSGVAAIPPTLDEYITQVVLPTLQRQKAGGAVAVKFELAYLRDLDIGNPSREDVELAYQLGAGDPGKPLNDTGYKLVQDYLFRVIATECGRLGLAVHFHGMAGAGSYFSVAGVNPMHMEPLLNDPTLRGTNFVMLHGGWPYVHEAGALLQKPNFYLDYSQQAILFPARTLATWLREWLELYPEKVLFATDGYPYSASLGWEESTWLASRNAKQALGLALTGMMHDGEISEARAEEIARMVLRGNAERLYGVKAAGIGQEGDSMLFPAVAK